MSEISYMYIPRIQVPSFQVRGKKEYLSPENLEKLLDGNVFVEEKLDGKITSINIRQYTSFEYFGEDLHWKHNVFYNKIPISRIPFVVGIDIYDHDNGEFFEFKSTDFWAEGIPLVPVLLQGKNLKLNDILALLDSKSAFGDEQIEGVVVKNYDKQIFGKIVNPKFDNDVDDSEHWLRKKRVSNRIIREE